MRAAQPRRYYARARERHYAQRCRYAITALRAMIYRQRFSAIAADAAFRR